MNISAYIPCYNARRTLADAIRSIQQQSIPVAELFVLDDGSADDSAEVARQAGAVTLRDPINHGRGAARAKAMIHAANDFVLACDAGVALAPDFLQRALAHMQDPSVAAVFGRVVQPPATNAVERWRGRHLFKCNAPKEISHHAALATGGVLLRRQAVLEVGNFDAALREREDVELGSRLTDAGWDVICDPSLEVQALEHHSLDRLLERYARWNVDPQNPPSWTDYLRLVGYSLKVMVHADLAARDPASACISLITPHYLFWSSRWTGNARPKPKKLRPRQQPAH